MSADARWKSTRWCLWFQEMGRLTRIPTPALDAVLALVAQRAKIAGLHEGNVRPAKEKIPVFA
jgi:2-dehydropantoate 2-reductase